VTMAEKAVEECEKALRLGQNTLFIRLVVAAVCAKVGKAEDARKILDDAEQTWKPGSPSAAFGTRWRWYGRRA